MSRFIDGPLDGTTLRLGAAPKFLRAVYSQSKDDFDALDLISDTPAVDEAIYVYQREGEPVAAMVDWSDGRGRRGGKLVMANYRYVRLEPAQTEALRDADAWLNWVAAREARR